MSMDFPLFLRSESDPHKFYGLLDNTFAPLPFSSQSHRINEVQHGMQHRNYHVVLQDGTTLLLHKNQFVCQQGDNPAMTRIRTWVFAATTQSTNHYTIMAIFTNWRSQKNIKTLNQQWNLNYHIKAINYHYPINQTMCKGAWRAINHFNVLLKMMNGTHPKIYLACAIFIPRFILLCLYKELQPNQPHKP